VVYAILTAYKTFQRNRNMSAVRTSQTHPLQIAEVSAKPSYGRIGITFCPGKHDHFAHTGAWARDLALDLDAIAEWGAKLVLTLVEHEELRVLKVPNLGEEIQSRGIEWRHLPIADFSVPTENFEQQWIMQGKEIRSLLRSGDDVLVHCKGGLGRAGMIAARLLVELGMDPKEAIRTVRQVRKGAIETSAQLALVRRTVAIP
jgi:protein-tyrosine phosphatase